jgi:hypothetical protein
MFHYHVNFYKTHKRSLFFPSFKYKNYLVPIDYNTYVIMLKLVAAIYKRGEDFEMDKKLHKQFSEIENCLFAVNYFEFEC